MLIELGLIVAKTFTASRLSIDRYCIKDFYYFYILSEIVLVYEQPHRTHMAINLGRQVPHLKVLRLLHEPNLILKIVLQYLRQITRVEWL